MFFKVFANTGFWYFEALDGPFGPILGQSSPKMGPWNGPKNSPKTVQNLTKKWSPKWTPKWTKTATTGHRQIWPEVEFLKRIIFGCPKESLLLSIGVPKWLRKTYENTYFQNQTCSKSCWKWPHFWAPTSNLTSAKICQLQFKKTNKNWSCRQI